MSKLSLAAEKRKITGKKVKQLRKQGLIPTNLFGKALKSLSLQVKQADFNKVFKEAKYTQIVYLKTGSDETPTLIQNVQRHPTSRIYYHVDFKKMDLKQKTETLVPIEVLGELDAVKSGEADLNLILDSVTVVCLPTNIPEKISLDISKLAGIGAEIKVKDLPKSADYEYKDEPEQIVLHIAEAKKEEIPAPVAAAEESEEPKEGAEAKEGEGKEGDKPAETKSEAKKEEQPKAENK